LPSQYVQAHGTTVVPTLIVHTRSNPNGVHLVLVHTPCSIGMSHMAEYTCCSSVVLERPNENTFTFTFTMVCTLLVAASLSTGQPSRCGARRRRPRTPFPPWTASSSTVGAKYIQDLGGWAMYMCCCSAAVGGRRRHASLDSVRLTSPPPPLLSLSPAHTPTHPIPLRPSCHGRLQVLQRHGRRPLHHEVLRPLPRARHVRHVSPRTRCDHLV
jgi:hypothetical protein